MLERLWPADSGTQEFFWCNTPDPRPDAEFLHFALVAEDPTGTLVGFARADQSEYLIDPTRAWVVVNVLPQFQRQGVGRALYDGLLERLAASQITTLQTSVRSDLPDLAAFFEGRGFTELRRGGPVLHLSLEAVKEFQIQDMGDRVAQAGITIAPLAPGSVGGPPDERVAALLNAWMAETHPVNLGYSEARRLNSRTWHDALYDEGMRPDLSFVATALDTLVGLCSAQKWTDTGGGLSIHPDLTAIASPWRGTPMGEDVALALKMHALKAARDSGFREFRVQTNPQMPWIRQEYSRLPMTEEDCPFWRVLIYREHTGD